MNRHPASPLSIDPGRCIAAVLVLAAMLGAAPAGAFNFQNDSNTITGSWDTTISLGEGWRLRNPNPQLIGTAEGGVGRSQNGDDGDLNYRSGQPFSQAVKLTTEFALKYRDFGAFARGSALYDYQVMGQQTARTPLSDAAKQLAGKYARLLDAFVYGKWRLGESHPLELRLGKQYLNWGESTFISGGLTGVNAIDVSALRVPGSELKEGFLPQAMARATLGLTENVSLEGFYMFQWTPTKPEPVGTYFSGNDFAVNGGSRVFLDFGLFSDQGTDFRPLGGPFISNFLGVPRSPDVEPKRSGQGGLALRWFAPDLGSGTEFGFYAMNYASRVPVVSARTGTVTGIGNAAAAATAVGAAAQALAAGLTPAAAINAATAAGAAAAAADHGNISLATLASYATIGANTYLGGGNVAAQATNLATNEFAQTASYFDEYPGNIQAFGVSFNTQLGTTGVALQGELTYRRNAPLQSDGVEILFASLTPLEQALFPFSAPPGATFPSSCLAAAPTLTRCGQLGGFGPGAVVTGWGRYDIWQFQTTATKAFPPMLGAQQATVVLEVGVTDVPNLPNKTSGGPNGQGLRLDGPGVPVSGSLPAMTAAGFAAYGASPQSAFADSVSWGYRLATRLDYPNLLGPWNITPRLSWQQDVKGITPGPGGNFIEGRYALTVGVNANLQQRWELDLSYTLYGGAGHLNELNDRDFVAATVKLSF
jgi:hypothetical protein